MVAYKISGYGNGWFLLKKAGGDFCHATLRDILALSECPFTMRHKLFLKWLICSPGPVDSWKNVLSGANEIKKLSGWKIIQSARFGQKLRVSNNLGEIFETTPFNIRLKMGETNSDVDSVIESMLEQEFS